MPKQTPHELYGDFTKEDERDAREYFSYVPFHELEKAIAGVKKFFSKNFQIEEEEELITEETTNEKIKSA